MDFLKKRNFIAEGTILALTGIVCRIIGMFYRIPLINIIGTRGNGYYTSAYSIYNILLILSSYSLPTAISKVISVRLSKERYMDVRTVLRVAFVYATLIGGLMCMGLWFGAPFVAEFMEKPFCEYALKCLAPTIWIMAYLGVLRGFFQGSGSMIPTALSQFFEQVVNAAVSIVMAVILFDTGVKANLIYGETEFSYAYGAAGGTLGTGAGALIGLLFLLLLFLLYGRMPDTNGPKKLKVRAGKEALGRRVSGRGGRMTLRNVEARREPSLHIAAVLIVTLVPILLSSTVYNISTVIDDLIFSRLMASLGLSASVVFLWGVFGEYRILFNIPVAMANSLGSSLIPSLTNAAETGDRPLVVRKIKLSIQFVMLISIPAAVGLFTLAGPICDLLFGSEDNTLLVNVLRIGTPAVIFFSLSTISNAILQGIGHLRVPLINALVSLIIHIAVLVVLVLVFRNIYSVIIANTVFAVFVTLLNSVKLHKLVRFRVNIMRTYLKPFLASVVMGAAVFMIDYFISGLLKGSFLPAYSVTLLEVVFSIAFALPIYLITLLLLRSFTKEELLEMPMGYRLCGLIEKLGLLVP